METATDIREALYNDQRTGLAQEIQLPLERITTLHGILFDLDPDLLVPGNSIFPPAETLRAFHENINQVLERHPLARHAEVRASGTGLHLIVWLRPAVELRSGADQERWNAIVKVVQRTLPVDPDMPGITGLTRAEGSVNSKSNTQVEVLKAGEAVEPRTVEDFMKRLVKAPFKEIARVLLGADSIQPCPVCHGENTRLDVRDRVGFCYSGCSKVKTHQLYELILKPSKVEAARDNPVKARKAKTKTVSTASGSKVKKAKKAKKAKAKGRSTN
jgi:hypothetical protein